jgi:hypothetical protein
MENQQIAYVPMYKSYIDAVAKLSPEDRLAIYEAIFEYGFTGIEPKFDNPYLEMGWNLVKPNLINNISRVKSNQENGKKGGRPPKNNSDAIKTTKPIETIQPEEKVQQIEENEKSIFEIRNDKRLKIHDALNKIKKLYSRKDPKCELKIGEFLEVIKDSKLIYIDELSNGLKEFFKLEEETTEGFITIQPLLELK